MRFHALASLCVLLVLTGIAGAQSTSIPRPRLARSADDVRAILAQDVDFPGFDDPKMTFEEALAFISRRYSLHIQVNTAAFVILDSEEKDVRRLRIADFPIPPRKGGQLDSVLRAVLARVPAPGLPFDPLTGKWEFDPVTGLPYSPLIGGSNTGAVCAVRYNGIEVTTAAALFARNQLPEPPIPLTAGQRKKVEAIRAALAREVDFPGINDPKTTLADALEFVRKQYGLVIRVDLEPFDYEGVKDLMRTPVAEQEIPAQKDLELDTVIRKILAKFSVPSGATFVVRPSGIDVTTERNLEKRYLRPEPRPAPSVKQLKQALAMRDTLVRPSGFRGFDDPKMTLNDALKYMEKRYDLHCEINSEAFDYEGIKDVGKTEVAENPIWKSDRILPGQVLEKVLAKVPVPSGAVFVIRPKGYIEITTKHAIEVKLRGERLPRDESK